ncbi:MAG TPA: protein translocase subunit SecD [Longimicrobiales bacterium]|nr:protein translocase subunit SecD [Longimicrobiales bacterium]
MFGTLKGRILLIAAVVAASVTFLMVNGITLGLDLQGGMYLALEVADPQGTMTAEARKDATDQALQVINNRIDEFGVSEPLIQKLGDDRIIVQLPGIRDEERAKKIIERTAFLEFQHVLPTQQFLNALPRIDRAIVASGKVATPAAADTSKPAGPSPMDLLFQQQRDSAAQARGDTAAADTSAADTSAADTAEAATLPGDRNSPLGSLLMESGQDGEFLVADSDKKTVETYLALPEVQRAMPRGVKLLWGKTPQGRGAELYNSLFVLEDKAFMRGSALTEASAGRDQQFGKTMVYFGLNRRGGRLFAQETGKHIGDRIAIVLDGQVQSAPNVISQISTNGQIEMGNATMEEARDLALVLRAGALPAPIRIIEQRSVGPALGQDSVDRGKIAGIIGLVAVLIIMVAIYRVSGILAIMALMVYVLMVLGGLAAFPDAALTAPGIAGLILSIGMALDANFLIFERIREEIDAGRSNRVAMDEGFANAMSAIVDSNLTTMITALILFQVGTGPVRGFAVTLTIGILASFFSAVFVTKTFYMLYLNRKAPSEPISI